jgi:uncharacterized damage-inducible protein DinB
MDREARVLLKSVIGLLERMSRCLTDLSSDELNWRPPIDGSNSLYVLGTHVLGNAEAWILGIALGRPIRRDRPAEFAAVGSDAAILIGAAIELGRTLTETVKPLAEALDQEREPSSELWGEGQPRKVTVRECLLHVIEHAAEHVGQMELTRDLMRAERGG